MNITKKKAQDDISYRVAIVKWYSPHDGMAEIIHDELCSLGHQPKYFINDAPIPKDVDIVFTFAPYGKLLPIFRQLANLPSETRPATVHWNTEGIPDPRIPWFIMRFLSAIRSWSGRLSDCVEQLILTMGKKMTAPWNRRALRFRYFGDYYYAHRKGLLNVFSDSSAVYADLHNKHGLPTVVAPWGATPRWYADLDLERDIDVLWMGKRGSKRRSNLLDQVLKELHRLGISTYVADNEDKPFIHGDVRTYFLNRAKITLNLMRTWHDDNFSRFSMAIPNRSLVASEPMLPHCPQYKPGVHYVEAPINTLAKSIRYYLDHENERQQIVETAYHLLTTQLTFGNSIKAIMDELHQQQVNRT